MNNVLIEIGTAKAAQGEIGEGAIKITKLAGGNTLSIPLTIINGKKEKMTLKISELKSEIFRGKSELSELKIQLKVGIFGNF